MDSTKKVNEDGKPGSESVDTADQHPQDDSLNRTEELNASIFNREPSTQIIKDTTMALSVAMMLEHDWSSPGSLPPLETLKNQSPSPYNASTPIQITCQLDTENIVNAAMYKKRSDLNSLQVPEEQTDVESVEITNDEGKKEENKEKNTSNEEKNNSAKKRKRVSIQNFFKSESEIELCFNTDYNWQYCTGSFYFNASPFGQKEEKRPESR
jgi:hypothetical protein